jgi:hypothetical protein
MNGLFKFIISRQNLYSHSGEQIMGKSLKTIQVALSVVITSVIVALLLVSISPCFVEAADHEISYGDLVTGSTVNGQINTYRFSGSANDSVLVRMGSIEGFVELRLYAPNTTLIGSEHSVVAPEVSSILDETGTYTIWISASSGAGGNYSMTLQKLSSPLNTQPSLLYGQTINGSLTAPGIINTYHFSAVANDSIVTTIGQHSIPFPHIRLYSPNGTELDSVTSVVTPEISSLLKDSGIYTILVLDTQASIGNYSLSLTLINRPKPPTESPSPSPTSNPNSISPQESIRQSPSIKDAFTTGAVTTVVVAGTLASAAQLNAQSNLANLPHSEFQKFLNILVGEDFKNKNKVKKSFLAKRSGQITAFAISICIMTVIFSFVQANGLPMFLNLNILITVVPSAVISSVAAKAAPIIADFFSARSHSINRQYRLWPIGIITFVVTGLLLSFPFSTPGILKNDKEKERELSPSSNALMAISRTMLILTLTLPFVVAGLLGSNLIADAGLTALLSTAFFTLVPIEPLPGKAILTYKPWIALLGFVSVGILLYGFMLKLLPLTLFLIAGLLAGLLCFFTFFLLRRSKAENGFKDGYMYFI